MNTERVREAVRHMTAYTLERRTCEVKLDQNESPFDLPREFKQRVLASVAAKAWNRYPDFELTRLRSALAATIDGSTENILVGNGSNELLFAALATFVAPGTPVVIPSPSFTLYEKIATILGGEIRRVVIDPTTGFLPTDALIAAVRGAGAPACTLSHREDRDRQPQTSPAVILLCSPNNPTGGVLREGDLERLLATGATVLYDRAYGDFARDRFPAQHERLVTFSTFSKAWGLAGLRIGWLASTAENCREIRKVALPYNLNIVSEEIALAALADSSLRDAHVDFAIAERERLFEALQKIEGVVPFPSQANFIAFRVRSGSAKLFRDMIAEDVLVRDVSKYPGLDDVLRVSIGTREENDRFLAMVGGRA